MTDMFGLNSIVFTVFLFAVLVVYVFYFVAKK